VIIESILIDRNKTLEAIKKVKKEGRQALIDGFWVVIFPGGTRIKPGEVSDINSGGAILAKQEKVPVYLVAHNAGEFWAKGTFIKKPGIVEVYVRQLQNVTDKDIKTINLESKEWFQKIYQN
jgi:1-acyl-sn-glycerol-3-phosphate acyltransferase